MINDASAMAENGGRDRGLRDRMNDLSIAAIVFLCTIAGALLGIFLSTRLPKPHRENDSKTAVQLVMGLIASVAALVLGLLISSTHSSFDAQQTEVRQLAVHLFELDRILVRFGEDGVEARHLLHAIVVSDAKRIWPEGGFERDYQPLQAQVEGETLRDRIANISPKTDALRFYQTRALQLATTMGETRLLLGEQERGALSWPFLVVLVFWLAFLFVGFGLFVRVNATVLAALTIGALSVAGAIFLILEMNSPYSGVMRISDAPIRDVLRQMAP
jgi:Protein of unknown function (DUF4239)